jgi:hypothetical protein
MTRYFNQITVDLEKKLKAQHDKSERHIDSMLQGKFNRFQMGMDTNWIGFKEEVIAIMTPVSTRKYEKKLAANRQAKH